MIGQQFATRQCPKNISVFFSLIPLRSPSHQQRKAPAHQANFPTKLSQTKRILKRNPAEPIHPGYPYDAERNQIERRGERRWEWTRLLLHDVGVRRLVKVPSVVSARLGTAPVGSAPLGRREGRVGVVRLVMAGWGVVGDDRPSAHHARRGVSRGVDRKALGKAGRHSRRVDRHAAHANRSAIAGDVRHWGHGGARVALVVLGLVVVDGHLVALVALVALVVSRRAVVVIAGQSIGCAVGAIVDLAREITTTNRDLVVVVRLSLVDLS